MPPSHMPAVKRPAAVNSMLWRYSHNHHSRVPVPATSKRSTLLENLQNSQFHHVVYAGQKSRPRAIHNKILTGRAREQRVDLYWR
jgi:hypothetical protein